MISWIIIGVLLVIISLLLTLLMRKQFIDESDKEFLDDHLRQNFDVLELLEIQIKEKKEILKDLKREIRTIENNENVPRETSPKMKSHYTMEEAKNIDWKNVKFK